MASNPADHNLTIMRMVAEALGDLRQDLVFVGGCATGILVTNIRSQPIRMTKDVDLVAEVASTQAYHALEKAIAARGFSHDLSEDAPICRWRKGELIVDLMPTVEGILGFHNRWYPLAVETAQTVTLAQGVDIRLVAAPAFIATKLEAFAGRGNGDYLLSHDMEDIVTVIIGRDSIVEEIAGAPEGLRAYLQQAFDALLNNQNFLDSLPGHLPPDLGSQAQLPRLQQRLRAIAGRT
jgi:predicted nucleotidyltransferase